MKVLDLCSGDNSVLKALEGIDYIGIDITGDNNLKLDLSVDMIVERLIHLLPVNWTPDFIWASPPCNKFSLATAVKGGNLYFQKVEGDVVIRSDIKPVLNSVYKNKSLISIQEETTTAIKIVKNVIEIIKYFDVPYAIENPTRAYTHFFIDIGVRNKTEYCMYGYGYKKPTSIWTDKELNLKRCVHKIHDEKIGSRTTLKAYGDNQKKIGSYKEKSSVPKELIKEIFNKIINEV